MRESKNNGRKAREIKGKKGKKKQGEINEREI